MLKFKAFICIVSSLFFFSCGNESKDFSCVGIWCISEVNYDVTDSNISQMNAQEAIVTSLSEQLKPDKIIVSENEIKLMIGNDELIKSTIEVIESFEDSISIKIDNAKNGVFSMDSENVFFRVDNATYHLSSCN